MAGQATTDTGTLSPAEIAALVTRAGFSDRVTAVAVVLGESGGNPNAINREPGNIDRGLWQISSKWHPNISDAVAFDVQASTAYALQISSGGTDFNLWNATRSPRFAGHLATARQAVDSLPTEGTELSPEQPAAGIRLPGLPDVGVGDIADVFASPFTTAFAGLRKAVGILTSFDFWKRAGLVIGGIVALWIMFTLVFGDDVQARVRDVASTVAGAKRAKG